MQRAFRHCLLPPGLCWPLALAMSLVSISSSLAQDAGATKEATLLEKEAARRAAVRGSFEARSREWMTPRTNDAINRGLASLASRQSADGSFGTGVIYRQNVAISALAGLAMISSGSTPQRGPYGQNIDHITQFILSRVRSSGFINDSDTASQHSMYGHGFATLYLAEVYGMSQEPGLRVKLQSAVQLIVNSQNPAGGWRYEPDGKEADVSVTICQIMALRAARNSGLAVPKASVDKCVDYVRRCQNGDGGFRYQAELRPQSAFPRSAAGVAALFSAGIYEGPEVERGVLYLLRESNSREAQLVEPHYYYGQYYAAQVMWQAGEAAWEAWFPNVRDHLLLRQHADGSWADHSITSEYATAMALIVLQTPNNMLPIFQR